MRFTIRHYDEAKIEEATQASWNIEEDTMNKKIAMAVMAAVLLLSLATTAFAQTPTPPTQPASPTPGETFWQTLADKLGVTADKLQQAVRDTLKDMVSKALKNGKLTQSQADKATAGIDQMPFDKMPFGRFLGGLGARLGARFAMDKVALQAAADKLGMTAQDLTKELRGGKSLTDVAKEKNVTADDLKTAMVNAVNAQVGQAVKDGKLTQTQADNIKAQIAKIDLDKLFGKMRIDRGRFNMGRDKGWFDGNRPFGPRVPSTPQPSTP
jgi:hypothetical protein